MKTDLKITKTKIKNHLIEKFGDEIKNKTFGGSLMTGFGSSLFPKSKMSKNAKAFKNKSGRGAGY